MRDLHFGLRPPSPGFAELFILKGLKVICFHTLLQVFILKVLLVSDFAAFSACLLQAPKHAVGKFLLMMENGRWPREVL
jgi:hypothetical protein